MKTHLVLFFILLALGCGRSRTREPASIDPQAYPACDAPSDPYRPEVTSSRPGSLEWLRRFGCEADDRAMGVAVTSDGSVVATGSFSGRVSFGGAPLVSGGRRDGFVARWDKRGKPMWTHRFGGLNSEAGGTGLALDTQGQVVVSGRFHGVLDASHPQLLSRSLDPFLLKMNLEGDYVWARRFDRAGVNQEGKVPFAPDPFGGVLFPVPSSRANANDAFIFRVDPQGELPAQIPMADFSIADLVVHEDRTVVIVGYEGQEEQKPAEGMGKMGRARLLPRASNQSQRLFVAKYDQEARQVWKRTMGDGGLKPGEPLVAMDRSGGIVVAFAFMGRFDVGTGPIEAGGGFDLFVMKLDPAGQTVWAQSFPGPQGNEWMNALAVDPAGSVVLGGAFERAVDFGAGPIMSAGAVSGFVARLDPLGRHLWSQVIGAPQSSAVVEAVALGENQVAVAGAFQGWTDFGAGLVPSSGQWDGFVAVLQD